MATGFITVDFYPSADVATTGTMDIPYGGSYVAADFAQAGERLIITALGNSLDQAADTFTTSYDADSVTVTYADATTIPAGTKVTIQLPLSDYAELTDNSGGTASNTIAAISATPTQAEVANAIASIVAKVNTLIALSQDKDNVPDDDRN